MTPKIMLYTFLRQNYKHFTLKKFKIHLPSVKHFNT